MPDPHGKEKVQRTGSFCFVHENKHGTSGTWTAIGGLAKLTPVVDLRRRLMAKPALQLVDKESGVDKQKALETALGNIER
ncbi:hypothetical protein, partial [Hyphomonas sp.]|uniref:hypothetical protein n=1 Tax=Hyphomonas sp. TaxID=87 RepID=UPI00356691B7